MREILNFATRPHDRLPSYQPIALVSLQNEIFAKLSTAKFKAILNLVIY